MLTCWRAWLTLAVGLSTRLAVFIACDLLDDGATAKVGLMQAVHFADAGYNLSGKYYAMLNTNEV